MKTIFRNVIAVIAGVVAGSIANMALVQMGPMIVSLPEGADVSTMEGLSKSMRLFGPQHFLFPFLAHALGTLVGAFVAAKLAASHAFKMSLGIGVWFLLGGIAVASMIGGPGWFTVADLVLAYLPMAYAGAFLAGATRGQPNQPR